MIFRERVPPSHKQSNRTLYHKALKYSSCSRCLSVCFSCIALCMSWINGYVMFTLLILLCQLSFLLCLLKCRIHSLVYYKIPSNVEKGFKDSYKFIKYVQCWLLNESKTIYFFQNKLLSQKEKKLRSYYNKKQMTSG